MFYGDWVFMLFSVVLYCIVGL